MLKKGEKVNVLTGKDKGKSGKVLQVLRNKNRVVVEGVNMIKRNQKPTSTNQTGGIIEREAPIHISNVKVVEEKTEKVVKKETKKVKKSNEKND